MKFHYVPVSLLFVASTCALGASSGSVEGRLSFSLTDLQPEDTFLPSVMLQGPVTFVQAFIEGQPVTNARPGLAQGPFGEARAEVFGDWQFKALGYETGVGFPSEGTSFRARALYYVPGDGGLYVSPRTKLTLTGTFTGEISVDPGPNAASSAYVWASLRLQAPAILGGGLEAQLSEASFEERLDQSISGGKSFSEQVVTVSVSNPTDFELRVHYNASINVGGVSPVPEPSAWIMALAGGLALLGLTGRKQIVHPV